MDEFRAWQKASNGLLNKIAFAPERNGVEEFVRTITDEGVTVALGHQMQPLTKPRRQWKLVLASGYMPITVCVA